mmetsp:Transcript_10287/g.28700  ORF Transcript_10287/g.28700 Transcript_10287/m.28700 type:complete len:108 (-) Transcript_10287:570-893(-)
MALVIPAVPAKSAGIHRACRRQSIAAPIGSFATRATEGVHVLLHVYDLGERWLASNTLSSDIFKIGGAFHVGVELCLTELFFGADGVNTCQPKMAPGHVYKQTIDMG